jgi:zinc/manganese transport system permease protein
MTDTLLFLAPPITACVLLAIMLGYFGSHILSRGIIFIDIAIAQIAALGTMIGLLLGLAEESREVQGISYLFTLVIIGSFAFLKKKELFIPPEAVIGIIYCLGLALALLLAERIPGGSNYITKTITGNILWVTWDKVLKCSFMFAAVGIIHLVFSKQMINISSAGNNQPYPRNKIIWLDLVFYLTFGFVVVKAVMIGGIFLVFTLLIAPSSAAMLLNQSWKARLAWSWILGIAGAITGIMISYYLNISNGPAIVVLLGIIVFALAFIKILIPKNKTA